jgi:hypothetical protein
MAAAELVDAQCIDVEPDDLAMPGERHGQRKPDVAKANDHDF